MYLALLSFSVGPSLFSRKIFSSRTIFFSEIFEKSTYFSLALTAHGIPTCMREGENNSSIHIPPPAPIIVLTYLLIAMRNVHVLSPSHPPGVASPSHGRPTLHHLSPCTPPHTCYTLPKDEMRALMKVASFITATLFIPSYPTKLVIITSPRTIEVRFRPPPLIMTVTRSL